MNNSALLENLQILKTIGGEVFAKLTNLVGKLVINKHLHRGTAHSDTQNIVIISYRKCVLYIKHILYEF